MNALVIGFGKMGMLHAATLNSLAPVKQILVCDTSSLVRDGLRNFQCPFPLSDDLDALLHDHPVDMAVIATPTASHAALFQKLIPRGIHLFIEKPFAADYSSAAKCLASLPSSPPKILIGHCLRYVPTFIEAKRLLDQGALGALRGFRVRMHSSDVLRKSSSWRFQKSQGGGGVLLDLGSHAADMTRHFFGKPQTIRGKTRSIVSRSVEDAAEAVWEYEDFTGDFEVSWSVRGVRKATLSITVEGKNGTLEVTDDSLHVELRLAAAGLNAGTHSRSITALESAVPFDLAGPMYTRQMLDWLNAIQHGTVHQNTLEENIQNMQILDQIRG